MKSGSRFVQAKNIGRSVPEQLGRLAPSQPQPPVLCRVGGCQRSCRLPRDEENVGSATAEPLPPGADRTAVARRCPPRRRLGRRRRRLAHPAGPWPRRSRLPGRGRGAGSSRPAGGRRGGGRRRHAHRRSRRRRRRPSRGREGGIADAIARLQPKMLVGAGGIKTRDDALELGELRPDYVFFGRFGYDNKPEPHPRNLGLAAWWASMVEIPCIAARRRLAGLRRGGGRDRRRVRRACPPPFSVKASILAGRSPRPTPCSTKKRRVSELRAVACAPPLRPPSAARDRHRRAARRRSGRRRPAGCDRSPSTPTGSAASTTDPAYGAFSAATTRPPSIWPCRWPRKATRPRRRWSRRSCRAAWAVKRDEAAAAKWYQAAAEQDLPEAQFQYALMLIDGRFVKQDKQGGLRPDGGRGRCRQPLRPVQLCPDARRSGTRAERHCERPFPTSRRRPRPICRTRNMRWRSCCRAGPAAPWRRAARQAMAAARRAKQLRHGAARSRHLDDQRPRRAARREGRLRLAEARRRGWQRRRAEPSRQALHAGHRHRARQPSSPPPGTSWRVAPDSPTR